MNQPNIPEARRNLMKRPASVGQVMEWITAGNVATMRRLYDKMGVENAKLFQQLEDIAVERVLQELERRSLRGRLKRWWRQFVLKRPAEILPRDLPQLETPSDKFDREQLEQDMDSENKRRIISLEDPA